MYTKNTLNSLTAFNNVEDPAPPARSLMMQQSSNDINIRDILSSIISDGSRSTRESSVRAKYATLTDLMGITKARKMLDHALVYNQRSDLSAMSPDDRLRGFFESPSTDADVQGVLSSSRSIGDGVVPGYGRSPYNVIPETTMNRAADGSKKGVVKK